MSEQIYMFNCVQSAHFAEVIIRMKNIASENTTLSLHLRDKGKKFLSEEQGFKGTALLA